MSSWHLLFSTPDRKDTTADGSSFILAAINYTEMWQPGAPEPKVWQHDLFREDRTPYDPREIELFKQTILNQLHGHA